MQTLIGAVEEVGGTYLVTADHGNAEDMVQRDKRSKKALMDGSGKPRMLTSHTLNPVSLLNPKFSSQHSGLFRECYRFSATPHSHGGKACWRVRRALGSDQRWV